MTYIVATGYCQDKEVLFNRWLNNTLSYSVPSKIYVINGGSKPHVFDDLAIVQHIDVENLGHVHDMTATQQLGGWSMSLLIGCLLAYTHRCDLIYKEQDCFAFGSWVERMYKDCEGKVMVMGKRNSSPECNGFRANSLLLIKNEFLLSFVQQYLAIKESDREVIPEYKFEIIKDKNQVGELSFGFDRSRPLVYEEDVFYAQQLTDVEIKHLEDRGLLRG